jgi:pilus assembly protein CpaF
MTAAPTPAAVWERIRRGVPPTPEEVGEVARAEAARLGAEGTTVLRRDLAGTVLGLGPLEPLVADEAVTDVLVNGETVWLDRGRGLERATVTLEGPEASRRLAVRLAALAGRRLDDATPFVDGLLPSGIRLHAVLPPLVDGGTHLSLRVPRRRAPDLATLTSWGMVDVEGADVLRALVRARAAFLVSGGTGTGKTTLLGALLAEVPPGERIVLVEDVRELSVRHPHVVRLQGRGANLEGRGVVRLEDLVRQALRMRPDRLVVGEVRGREVRDLLGALNTGHEGGASTVHANTAHDVVNRVVALGALAGLSREAVLAQLAGAVDVVVHLARTAGRRVVQEVGVVEGDGTRADVVTALWRQGDGLVRREGWSRLAPLLGERP